MVLGTKFRLREERALRALLLTTKTNVQQILESELGRRYPPRMKARNEIRLLVLASWSRRYKISLSFILTTLVPYWSERFSSRRRKVDDKVGFGVKMETLTGKKSEEILLDAVKREFPNGEHIAEWKLTLQKEFLGMLDSTQVKVRPIISNKRIADYVEKYGEKVLGARARLSKGYERRQKSKPYRDNPWK